jgi:23S rRNA G2445 N2-methylase RlmL
MQLDTNDLQEMIKNYPESKNNEKQEFIRRLSEDRQALATLYSRLPGDESRAVLRILTDACRKKQAALELRSLEKEQGLAKNLLQSTDAKARKNAAALVGLCCAQEYTGLLLEMLQKEDTEFVRPSLLLALGKTGSANVYAFLKSYTPKNTVDKHREEEAAALLKAMSALSPAKPQTVKPDVKGFTLVLACAPGQTGLTKEELDEHEFPYRDFEPVKDSLSLQTANYTDVFACRTFLEALVFLGKCPANLQSLSVFLKNPKFSQSIRQLFHGRSLNYRIEVKGAISHEERIKIIEAAVGAIHIPGFANSPSSYAFELRIIAEKQQFVLLVKPSAELDTRFAYREKTLPASIHPVMAACILRHIYPYLRRDADVLDPFCGSGAMLFERAIMKPCKSLTGIDKEKYAIACSKANEAAAKITAHFINTDILNFVPEMKYDEIISNMPFGHRVGSHEDNETLYAGFIKGLDGLLKPKGMAFLFTNDKTLLKDLIEREQRFTIVEETLFNAGNLHPSLFILRRNKK